MRNLSIYLAGPDVFFEGAEGHNRRKVAMCEQYGFVGLAPLFTSEYLGDLSQYDDLVPGIRNLEEWKRIYVADVLLMKQCDLIVANLTPYLGCSADAGTLVELGWFNGAEKPCFAYSNSPLDFEDRIGNYASAFLPPRLQAKAPTPPESFSLAENLMAEGSVLFRGGDRIIRAEGQSRLPDGDLSVFERCLKAAAAARSAGRLR